MHAISDQQAKWRLMSADALFVNKNAVSKPESAGIGKALEATERTTIKKEKSIAVVGRCSMQ